MSSVKHIYKKPYWIIEFEINKMNTDCNLDENKVIAYVTTRNMAKLKSNEATENVATDENEKLNKNKYEKENVATDKNENLNENEYENLSGEFCSNFECTIKDRQLNDENEATEKDNLTCEVVLSDKSNKSQINNRTMLWHVRMGHLGSIQYLKELQKKLPEIKTLKSTVFDDSIKNCEVCMISKIKSLPFKTVRQRATKPLQIIHSDVMGMINPATYPKGYKYISVFIDGFSRLAMAYPIKTKDETGYCMESFVKNARNLLEKDAKVCYLQSDQGTEFTSGYTTEVLKRLGAELQLACPDTPQHNSVSERFNQTIQREVRALMNCSGLPENMWDLALGAAVYAYNRTPHVSNNMESPMHVFRPDRK